MAVDTYVGSLARYYSGSWENQVQQEARRKGSEYTIVRPSSQTGSDESDDSWSKEEIVNALQSWYQSFSNTFQIEKRPIENFQEAYFTKRILDFSLLYASSIFSRLPEEKDKAVLLDENECDKTTRLAAKKLGLNQLNDVNFWLPCAWKGDSVVEREFIDGSVKVISNVQYLLKELNLISLKIFGFPLATLQSQKKEIIQDSGFELLKMDLLTLYESSSFALEKRCPLLFDY